MADVRASRASMHHYNCCIPNIKPLLNQGQCQKYHTWAKDKKKWTADQWAKVFLHFISKLRSLILEERWRET